MMVAILMSTYNGGEYLQEQLDSIKGQTFSSWHLYIRDDGSSDETCEIIRNNLNDNITLLVDDEQNLGAKLSFEKLLKNVDAPIYMFCDQDDIWLPNKVEISVKEYEKIEIQNSKDTPILVYTDAYVVNSKLKVIDSSFWHFTRVGPDDLLRENYMQVFNASPGCTMLINEALKKRTIPFPSKAPMHDWWIAITAQRYGIVQPISQSLMYYRQHSNNTIGAGAVNKTYFWQKILKIKTSLDVQRKHLEFLKQIGGISTFEFFKIKCAYTLKRLFIR